MFPQTSTFLRASALAGGPIVGAQSIPQKEEHSQTQPRSQVQLQPVGFQPSQERLCLVLDRFPMTALTKYNKVH